MRQILTAFVADIFSMGKIQEFRDKVGGSQGTVANKDLWKCLGAEFIGTFILMVLGCGCTIQLEGAPHPSLTGIAICWGFLVATLAQSLGHISGCHMNPAVTIAMLVIGKIQFVKAMLYIVVQCVAAIVGVSVLKALTPGDTTNLVFGYTRLAEGLSEMQGFGIEFMITFVLLFIIFAVSDENRHMQGSAPLAVGLALIALIMYGAPLTGAGMNPARVLGPCVIIGKFESHWLYWIGPLGGAVTSAAVYQGIFRGLKPEEAEAAMLTKERKSRERESMKESNGTTSMPPV